MSPLIRKHVGLSTELDDDLSDDEGQLEKKKAEARSLCLAELERLKTLSQGQLESSYSVRDIMCIAFYVNGPSTVGDMSRWICEQGLWKRGHIHFSRNTRKNFQQD